MSELIEKFGTMNAWLLGTAFVFLRYFLFAGLAFLGFYVFWKSNFTQRKIQKRFPQFHKIRHEIQHSLLTAGIFALLGIGIHFLKQAGYTQIYTNISEFGWAYLIFSFAFLTVLHDTYFYWMHRFMHHPKLFRWFHLTHHVSNNPNPWTSLSFHPLEAVVEVAIIPLAVLIMPFHPLALFAFATWSLAFNVLGHLGYELFPKGFVHHRIGKWINTSTHHNMHHARSNCNYGLYYNYWDRWMGTNAADYEKQYDAIHQQKASIQKIISTENH